MLTWVSSGDRDMPVLRLLALASLVTILFACSSPTPTPIPPTPTPTPAPTPTPSPVSASDTVVIEPGSVGGVSVRVQTLNRVTGDLTIEGGSGDDIDFWITDPAGNTVLGAGRVSRSHTFSFIAATDGNYQVNLGNTFSLFSNKVVTVSLMIHWR